MQWPRIWHQEALVLHQAGVCVTERRTHLPECHYSA